MAADLRPPNQSVNRTASLAARRMDGMTENGILARMLALFALLAAVLTAYLLWARPYQLRWGATDSEVKRSIPGDELHGNPTFPATRAITIEGTPDEIWPWLLQMGYGRAGFYGYDILENLGSQRGVRSANRILPDFHMDRSYTEAVGQLGAAPGVT